MSSFYFSLAISRIETLRDDEREKNIYRKPPCRGQAEGLKPLFAFNAMF